MGTRLAPLDRSGATHRATRIESTVRRGVVSRSVTWRAMIFCLTLALCGSLTTSLAAEPGAGIASQGVDRSCHKVGLVTMKIIASGLKPGRKFSGSGYA